MAGSSYCELTITLKNGEEIGWAGEDGFDPAFVVPRNAKKKLLHIASAEDLKSFISDCVYDPYLYDLWCKEFDEEVNKIKNFEDLKSISLAWGSFDLDDGFPVGESIDFDFETQICKKKSTARKEFIKEMKKIYGDMLDEEDF